MYSVEYMNKFMCILVTVLLLYSIVTPILYEKLYSLKNI